VLGHNRSIFCSVRGLGFGFMTAVLWGQLSNSEITYVTFCYLLIVRADIFLSTVRQQSCLLPNMQPKSLCIDIVLSQYFVADEVQGKVITMFVH
jgi:hypothetical protein